MKIRYKKTIFHCLLIEITESTDLCVHNFQGANQLQILQIVICSIEQIAFYS